MDIRKKIKGFKKGEDSTNSLGNLVERYFTSNGERYYYDFMEGFFDAGWEQYDTDQDAWYFGVWINEDTRQILTYAEGDTTLVTCKSEESYKEEIRAMNEFHGEPPPAMISIDTETGQVTEYRDERPKV